MVPKWLSSCNSQTIKENFFFKDTSYEERLAQSLKTAGFANAVFFVDIQIIKRKVVHIFFTLMGKNNSKFFVPQKNLVIQTLVLLKFIINLSGLKLHEGDRIWHSINLLFFTSHPRANIIYWRQPARSFSESGQKYLVSKHILKAAETPQEWHLIYRSTKEEKLQFAPMLFMISLIGVEIYLWVYSS